MSPNYQARIQSSSFSPSLLPMGGTNPHGSTIAVNQRYLTLDGRPWLPVMGEFHFSRYPHQHWEDEILKMKAGGITVVATYIFWIHIEELEGQFDWSGSRDLRRFVALCGKHGLYTYPRIGPWAHGECRSGGFPDWLLERCGREVRGDYPLYLSYVRRYYGEISRQLAGLLWKDGGPVIGIQIENELLDNAAHIRTLKQAALEAGLDVPLYTMTGWGPADVPAKDLDAAELTADAAIIPVFGGYPDAFWDRQVETWSRPSRKNYFFSTLRDDNTIGADLNRRADVGDLSYLERFPYGTCETGGGMQVAYHRRPFIQPDDIAALALVKIGSGSNMQGYYMYHGGANPPGAVSTLHESQATGYPNDLPVINYDFQAPLGQYGQVRESYHALRLLHLFLNDFGHQLAPLPVTLPERPPSGLDDRQTLRWAVRSDGKQGFLFINNYQRIETLPDQEYVRFDLALNQETLRIPACPVQIPSGLYAIWPFNLDLSGALLKYATAQLVCQVAVQPAALQPDGAQNAPCYVFFAPNGIDAEFAFDARGIDQITGPADAVTTGGQIQLSDLAPGTDCFFTITKSGGERVHFLLLSKEQARRLWKANLWGQERLFLSSASLIFADPELRLQFAAPFRRGNRTLRTAEQPAASAAPLRRENQNRGTLGGPENGSAAPSSTSFAVFPHPGGLAAGSSLALEAHPDGIFTRYFIAVAAQEDIPVDARLVQPSGPARTVSPGPSGVAQAPDDADFARAETWQIRLPAEALQDACELFLVVDYLGDAARAYIGDRLIDDDFFFGRVWEIGLSRFAADGIREGLTLRFLPIRKDAPIYLPSMLWPQIKTGDAEHLLKKVAYKIVKQVVIKSG